MNSKTKAKQLKGLGECLVKGIQEGLKNPNERLCSEIQNKMKMIKRRR